MSSGTPRGAAADGNKKGVEYDGLATQPGELRPPGILVDDKNWSTKVTIGTHMQDIHAQWDSGNAARSGILFVDPDFRGKSEVFFELLRLSRIADLAFPSTAYVGKREMDAGIKRVSNRKLLDADDVDLDFWRRTSGLMLFNLRSERAWVSLNGWDPNPRLYPFDPLHPNRCAFHIEPTEVTMTGREMTRSWMRELFSQVLKVFDAKSASVRVSFPGKFPSYDAPSFRDSRGLERDTSVTWLTYYDPVVLDHVGRDKVERCSATVEFDFFGGALLCVAEEPLALHPRELYERTRKVNEELDQIAPPKPGDSLI